MSEAPIPRQTDTKQPLVDYTAAPPPPPDLAKSAANSKVLQAAKSLPPGSARSAVPSLPKSYPPKRQAEQVKSESAPSAISEEPESDVSVHVLLADSPNKHSFLFTVSIAFFAYFLALSGVLVYGVLNERVGRIFYRSMNGKALQWIILGVVIFIKMVCGLSGKRLRSVAKIAFIFDLILSCLVVFCLYFYLNEVYATEYAFYGSYLAFFIGIMTTCALGWVVGVFLGKSTYKPGIAFIIMFVTVMIGVGFTLWKTDAAIIRRQTLTTMTIIVVIIAAYLAFEGRQLIEYRAHKFYEEDAFVGLFAVWTDWFGNFWVDSVRNTKFMKRRQKKKEKEARKKAGKKVEGEKVEGEKVEETRKEEESNRPFSIDLPPISIRPSELDNGIDIKTD